MIASAGFVLDWGHIECRAEAVLAHKSIGAFEPGFEADLIVAAENPLDDVATLQDPLLVVSNGRVVLDRLNFGKK